LREYFITGNVNLESLKKIRQLHKQNELSDLFDQEIINETDRRLKLEEEDEGDEEEMGKGRNNC
jgi:hypothetical protein